MSGNPLQLLAAGLAWPESPRWHDGALWFSDVHQFRLMRLRPGEAAEVIAEVPGRPSGMGFMPDGRLLLATALQNRLYWVAANGELTLAADLSAQVTGLLNDMIVDATGRAWVGDTGFDFSKNEAPRPGALLSWTPDAGVQIAAHDLSFPNGLAITPDGRMLYLAESFGKRISVFDIEPGGRLSAPRLHCALDNGPDGLCLDAQGALWVPLPMLNEFQRIAADGQVTQRIRVGTERAISCVLGGADRRSLYLGSAEVDDTDKQAIKRQGFIRATQVDVGGSGIP